MAAHSSILAWEIPWTGEPGGLQSICSQKVGQNWARTRVDLLGVSIKENKAVMMAGCLDQWILCDQQHLHPLGMLEMPVLGPHHWVKSSVESQGKQNKWTHQNRSQLRQQKAKCWLPEGRGTEGWRGKKGNCVRSWMPIRYCDRGDHFTIKLIWNHHHCVLQLTYLQFLSIICQ